MNKSLRNIILALAGTALLSGLGCASKTDVESMQAANRRTSAEQRKMIMQLEQELSEARAALRNEIEKSNDPVRQKTADIWVELNSLRQDFAQLKGDLEVMEIRMDRQVGQSNSTSTVPALEQRIDNMAFALENQLNVDLSAAKQTPATTPVTTAATPVPEKQPAKQAEAKDPAKALYDNAYALYKDGKYEKARSYWAEFVKTFPRNKLVASALFWQGQSYYKMKNYSRAALLYDDVIQKHPKSSKFRAAKLKQGFCLHYLGKDKVARFLLEELIADYPKSVEAKQAKNFLTKLK